MSEYFLKFDELDNPMQLSKIGNWVITFIHHDLPVQLAITHVIPRQVHHDLEIRKITIEQVERANTWKIIKIEAFNGQLNQEVELSIAEINTQNLIQKILLELAKYDVHVELID